MDILEDMASYITKNKVDAHLICDLKLDINNIKTVMHELIPKLKYSISDKELSIYLSDYIYALNNTKILIIHSWPLMYKM